MNDNKVETASDKIRHAVAAKITDVGKQSVHDAVIDKLVADELNRRQTDILGAMDKLSKLKNDRRKIKPDLRAFDAEGKEVAANFSASKIEELKKLNERIEKVEKAIEAALEREDFNKIRELKD